MISYLLSVKMADQTLEITDKMIEEITKCTTAANNTVVSKREKRTFKVIGREGNDPYTIQIQIISKNAINATRSLSTLSRKVTENEYLSKILEGHSPNGSVFKATQLDKDENYAITFRTDTDIVSEIISIFFSTDMLPKEKELASNTAAEIRRITLDYINQKMGL